MSRIKKDGKYLVNIITNEENRRCQDIKLEDFNNKFIAKSFIIILIRRTNSNARESMARI